MAKRGVDGAQKILEGGVQKNFDILNYHRPQLPEVLKETI